MNNPGSMELQRLMHSILDAVQNELQSHVMYQSLPPCMHRETVHNTIARVAMEQTYALTVRQLLHVHHHLLQHARDYSYKPGDDKIHAVWHHASHMATTELAHVHV